MAGEDRQQNYELIYNKENGIKLFAKIRLVLIVYIYNSNNNTLSGGKQREMTL